MTWARWKGSAVSFRERRIRRKLARIDALYGTPAELHFGPRAIGIEERRSRLISRWKARRG